MEDLRALYEDRAAQQYAEAGPLPDPRIDRKFRRICELVRAQLPCEAFLDAGCGDGRYLAALDPELPARRAGTDIAERILETARARVEADFRQANLEALPFEDGAFDLVLCSQVIEHVLNPQTAVAELARVLRPGGTLVISTDNARNYVTRGLNAPRTLAVRALRLRGARGRIESPATPYTRASFRRLLERCRLHRRAGRDVPVPPDVAARRALVTRTLNAVDARLPAHGFGDIIAAVARK